MGPSEKRISGQLSGTIAYCDRILSKIELVLMSANGPSLTFRLTSAPVC